HGTRLDSVDSNWHLTSPTPYDPPLTYGGWTQARALGAKIASLLNVLEAEAEAAAAQQQAALDKQQQGHPHARFRPRRRRRITIHTSPFLRCVQTSIAIAAGVNQDQRPTQQPSLPSNRPARSRSGEATLGGRSLHSPQLHPIPEPPDGTAVQSDAAAATTTTIAGPGAGPGIHKCRLKVDPFLGEWLCHDYYEGNGIMAPPGSEMMLAAAKAELMRRDEQIETGWSVFGHSQTQPVPLSTTLPGATARRGGGGGGGGDENARPASATSKTWSPQTAGTSPTAHFKHRDRSATTSSPRPHISVVAEEAHPSLNQRPLYYMPPAPTYAISHSASIPPGYVAHARDACTVIDFTWDSLRGPARWGSGGEYGEEWASMHARFERGLRRLVGWYESGGADEQDRTVFRRLLEDEREALADDVRQDEEEEIDDVVILVSHGAGCNALLGALTGDPVLTDVPMCSLSVAVRKDLLHKSAGEPAPAASSAPSSAATSRRSSLISSPSTSSHQQSRPRTGSQSNHSHQYFNAFTPSLSKSSSVSSLPSVTGHEHEHDSEHDSAAKTVTLNGGKPAPAAEQEETIYEPAITGDWELKLLASVEHLRGQNPHHNLSHSRSTSSRSRQRGHPAQDGMHHHAHSFTAGRPSSLVRLSYLYADNLKHGDADSDSAIAASESPGEGFLPSALSSFSIATPGGDGVTMARTTRRPSGLWGNTSSMVDDSELAPAATAAANVAAAVSTRPTSLFTTSELNESLRSASAAANEYAIEADSPTRSSYGSFASSSPQQQQQQRHSIWTAPRAVSSATGRHRPSRHSLSPLATSTFGHSLSPSSFSSDKQTHGGTSPSSPAAAAGAVSTTAQTAPIAITRPGAPPAQHGLWGSPTLPSDQHKRRWSVQDRPPAGR
ncbi:hypothetical protein KEM52_006058, partial [Ascosphaera acerosa]